MYVFAPKTGQWSYLFIKFSYLQPTCKRVQRLLRQVLKERRGDPSYGRFATAAELEHLLSSENEGGGGGGGGAADVDGGALCSVCTEPFSDVPVASAFGGGGGSAGSSKRAVTLSCGHIFCQGCLEEWLRRESTCPLCRASVADAGPAGPRGLARGASTIHFF